MMSSSTTEIVLEEYNPEWQNWFRIIKNRIEGAVGEEVIDIEHYGSTSVIGMHAKPRIDVLIICKKGKFDLIKDNLKKIHYKHRGDLGVTGRENFRLTQQELIQILPTHNLNVCEEGAHALHEMMLFRDQLRKYPELREEYKKLKLDLADKYPNDINNYAEGKSEFVNKVLNYKIEE